MDFGSFFLKGPPPADALFGYYDWQLVGLSCFIAILASYVALDIAERIKMHFKNPKLKLWWLGCGAIILGLGIWTMHFIGMMAFILPIPLSYNPSKTALSLFIAILSSSFAFYLIKDAVVNIRSLMVGGLLLGCGIAAMHYVGIEAMVGVETIYLPSLFFLSLMIAIIASEAALWLMIRGRVAEKHHNLMKIGSSLIMGFAIWGMHYTGMQATIFIQADEVEEAVSAVDPHIISIFIAIMTMAIISFALFASYSWLRILEEKNKKLFEAEGRIRAILSAASNGIFVLDENGVIEMSNYAGGKIFGYPSEELVSQNIGKFVKEMNPQEENSDARNLTGINLQTFDSEFSREFIGLARDGRKIPIEATLSITFIDNKELYIILVRDISERKQSEEKIKNLNLKLVTAARSAGMAEVASSILHNVGNALNSISLSIELLLQKTLKKEDKFGEYSAVSKLINEHKKLGDLELFFKSDKVGQHLPEFWNLTVEYWRKERMEDLKELENLNSKVDHIKDIVLSQQSVCDNPNIREKISINQLLDDALAVSSIEIEKCGIIVERDFGKVSPVFANRAQLLQALINILKNAVESLSEVLQGERRLVLRTRQQSPDLLRIEMIDNGIGIQTEDLKNIFDIGFTHKLARNGIGLNSSALAMHEIGGSLMAFSEGPGKGASFIFSLPTS